MISKTILLVEDNDDDALLMQRALALAGINNPLRVVEDGQAAIDYLAGRGKYADRKAFPLPSVVFLDLKLPYKPDMTCSRGYALNLRCATSPWSSSSPPINRGTSASPTAAAPIPTS